MFFMPLSYWLFAIPGLILAGLATIFTKTTFAKYARFSASSGLTGAEAAQRMLADQGIHDVRIEPVRGFLSDHYDPMSRTLRLSPGVYGSRSLSAIGVACHEAGHALQHAAGYAPLSIRSALVPLANVGSNAAYFFLILGMLFSAPGLIKIGALVFLGAVVFAFVTLPVEWNASARAKQLMVASGIVGYQESKSAGRVLDAAFMTYVAAAVSALLTLIYYLMRAGVLGGNDD
jgi:Zn-dependent membrane protease YugP